MMNGIRQELVLEACVEGIEEAMRAEVQGAHRIELCSALQEGGITPSIGLIREAVSYLTIPVFVMIRPRGGNFVYSSSEIRVMKEDIVACREAGVHGVVFGMLQHDGSINLDQLYTLVEVARPMQITFHKAIDSSWNIPYELGRLRDAGIHRVLSSGGCETALEGAPVLNEMLRIANGKIKIVVAGKVTCDNVNDLAAMIPASEFHGKKIVGNLN
ncbi:MAG: copper homeostasis protein CutC [Bacteroidales bacterium]